MDGFLEGIADGTGSVEYAKKYEVLLQPGIMDRAKEQLLKDNIGSFTLDW